LPRVRPRHQVLLAVCHCKHILWDSAAWLALLYCTFAMTCYKLNIMQKEKTAFLGVQVPRQLKDDVRRLAREHDRTASSEVREALRSHLALNRAAAALASEQRE